MDVVESTETGIVGCSYTGALLIVLVPSASHNYADHAPYDSPYAQFIGQA
jgi:hypothetical protein